ncbi:hypothetical protein Slin15195_G050940 [Septoria linicola]|uniref:Uncharacterized protein n=1 Tax=Septoria linicola TaxID=215465 RepID=A0A9Q9ASJ9_9PEZI|nr:hypothetical protein Slin15195_G050940 [Septoria linicola]
MEGTSSEKQKRISSQSESNKSTSVETCASTDSSSTGGINVQRASTITLTHLPRTPTSPGRDTANTFSPVSPLDTAFSVLAPPVSPVDDVPVTTAIGESLLSSTKTSQDDTQAAQEQTVGRGATPQGVNSIRNQETQHRTPDRAETDAILNDEKRKPRFITSVRQLSRSSSWGRDLGISPPEDIPEWQPTLLRIAQLIGIAALLLVLCCMLASLGILIGSNGEKVADWPWSPSVYLAISSAVISRSLQFALLQAIPLAWWYKAYRGSTVDELQRHWESGQGICRALYNAKTEPILAFAMIASALVIADGPFLQKASSVKSELQTSSTLLQFPVAPELPTGFGGRLTKDGMATSHPVDPALDGFTYNSTLVADISGCDGDCRATVRGPGVMVRNCSSKTWPLTPQDIQHNASSTWGSGISGKVAPMPLFNIQIRDKMHADPPFAGPEEVELQIGIANFSSCTGHYTETTCKLVSAVLEYDVEIHKKNVMKFARPPSEARIVAMANNTFVNRSDSEVPLTITVLGAFLQGQIAANATMEAVTDPRQTGAAIMPDRNSFNNMVTKYTIKSTLCNSSFADPTNSIIDQFNTLMFRAGIAAANSSGEIDWAKRLDPGLQLRQQVDAEQTVRLNVFRSDLRWWAGAVILEFLAVLAILPVFWGYWRLGLHVTMSPLEIANVFQAPLLNSVNSASGSRGVVRKMGDVRVQCGMRELRNHESDRSSSADEASTTGYLLVAEAEEVVQPRRGTRFVE